MKNAILKIPESMTDEVGKALTADGIHFDKIPPDGVMDIQTVMSVAGVGISFIALCLQFYQTLVDRLNKKKQHDTIIIETDNGIIVIDPADPKELFLIRLEPLKKYLST